MTLTLDKSKAISLLLVVVALAFNLFQPSLAAANGYESPELVTSIGICVGQNNQGKASPDPELDNYIPASFNNIKVINQPVVVFYHQLPTKLTLNYQSIQARAPPFIFV